MTKRCKSCGKVKAIGEFYRHPSTADGLLSNCKECHRRRVYTRKYPEHNTWIEAGKGESMNHNGNLRFYSNPDVAKLLENYSPRKSAKKHHKALLKVAIKQRTPSVYQCPVCKEIILSMVPVRWCPLCNHWMGTTQSERVQAGWRWL